MGTYTRGATFHALRWHWRYFQRHIKIYFYSYWFLWRLEHWKCSFAQKNWFWSDPCFFLNLQHSRTNPKPLFLTQVVPRRGSNGVDQSSRDWCTVLFFFVFFYKTWWILNIHDGFAARSITMGATWGSPEFTPGF